MTILNKKDKKTVFRTSFLIIGLNLPPPPPPPPEDHPERRKVMFIVNISHARYCVQFVA
jgi:hypothetical protein